MSSSVSESDVPSSSNQPTAHGPESQPKMETEIVPSSAGTSKSHMFKLGMLLDLKKKMDGMLLRVLEKLFWFPVCFHILKCLANLGFHLW